MLNTKLLLIAILLVFVIIFSWFSTGQIISNNSEENLNILSPTRTAIKYSSYWWSTGTGSPIPFFTPRATAFWTLSVFEKADFPVFLIQAIFLGVIMLVGVISMYLLTIYGFQFNSFVSMVSSLFYLLNIYSLTQVWKRFLYNGMIVWAYLPLFLLFWFKWIIEGKFKWLFLFLTTSLIFTYTFAQPAFFLTFWIPAAILVIVKAWEIRRDYKQVLKLGFVSLVGLILWVVVNIWWLYPTFIISQSWTNENFPKPSANLDVLTAVSASFPVREVLLLRQSWYLGKANDWSGFYQNPLVYLISIGILVITILGLIKLKNPFKKYLLVLALVGLFVSKGSNFPLGFGFFNFLFSTFPITASLRNPYEKFGVVWLLPYAIFFGFGLYWLSLKIKDNFKRVIFLAITLILSCGLLVYPMWNGDIFPPKHRVIVPDYYNNANIFLNLQGEQRYFHIPFLDEGNKMNYDWGYVGEDPSEHIFDGENLSSAYIPTYSKILKQLPNFYDKKTMPNIFGMLGIKSIILQKDITYPEIDFDKTQKQIESWQGIKKTNTFGKLDLYYLDPQIVKPVIYTSFDVVKVNTLEEGLEKVASSEWDNKSIFTFSEIGDRLKEKQVPQISFVKISSTEYKVNVNESNTPYVLVLNNTYDELWEARIDKKPIKEHFMVNGFANGWLVERTGDYQIEIVLKIWPWD